MNTTVLIMAAGNAARFDGRIKQLLPLPNNETVIGRQIRQIQRLGHNPIIVTHLPELQEIGDYVVPNNRETLCDSILSTADLWGDKTVITLGDVIFTRFGIELLFGQIQAMSVVGNEAEMYGMSFLTGAHEKAKQCLATASKITENASKGKMRYFYWEYAGVRNLDHPVLTWLRDNTNDIDSPAEYNNTLAKWNKGDG